VFTNHTGGPAGGIKSLIGRAGLGVSSPSAARADTVVRPRVLSSIPAVEDVMMTLSASRWSMVPDGVTSRSTRVRPDATSTTRAIDTGSGVNQAVQAPPHCDCFLAWRDGRQYEPRADARERSGA
jgi:hypothetical protein